VRDLLSVDRVANQIRLRRSTFLGTFLLVEGSSDKFFYERFVNKQACELVSAPGKPSSKLRVIAVLEILEKSNFQGVLAIVDADFDHLETSLINSPNLFRTDTHDRETMLIKSCALDKVIALFGSEDKIANFGRDVRTVLLEASTSVGYLRWVSQCDGFNLTFDDIKFNKFVDKQTLQIDELKLIQEVKNKSQAFSLQNEDIQQQLINKKISSCDPWQVCCGHDLVEILSLGLRNAIGSNKADDVQPRSDERKNTLESHLLLSYEEIYFLETQLYADILVWESNNQPFKVLRNNA
jgi:Protein of unknown function (DUF4435)